MVAEPGRDGQRDRQSEGSGARLARPGLPAPGRLASPQRRLRASVPQAFEPCAPVLGEDALPTGRSALELGPDPPASGLGCELTVHTPHPHLRVGR